MGAYGVRRSRMDPMDIVGKSKEDASLPKGGFVVFVYFFV